jgi:hypothetical protein
MAIFLYRTLQKNLAIGVRAITDTDFDRTGFAIGEKVDDAAAFEIADDAAVALATLPGPIVNAD